VDFAFSHAIIRLLDQNRLWFLEIKKNVLVYLFQFCKIYRKKKIVMINLPFLLFLISKKKKKKKKKKKSIWIQFQFIINLQNLIILV